MTWGLGVEPKGLTSQPIRPWIMRQCESWENNGEQTADTGWRWSQKDPVEWSSRYVVWLVQVMRTRCIGDGGAVAW